MPKIQHLWLSIENISLNKLIDVEIDYFFSMCDQNIWQNTMNKLKKNENLPTNPNSNSHVQNLISSLEINTKVKWQKQRNKYS